MQIVSKIISLILVAFLLSACENQQQRNQRIIQQKCSPSNYINWVRAGDGECLALEVWGAEELQKNAEVPKTMLVYLAGDHRLSRDSTLPYSKKQIQSAGIIGNKTLTVLLSRPGYSVNGRTSTGDAHNGYAYYSQQNVDAIAAAIKNLKQHYQPQKVLLIGNSSGASMALIALAQHNDIADFVIASSCACSFFQWGSFDASISGSLDPIDFVGKLPKEQKIALFVGDNDDNTSAVFSKKFVDKAIKLGFKNVKMHLLRGANHAQTKTNKVVLAKIKQILRQ